MTTPLYSSRKDREKDIQLVAAAEAMSIQLQAGAAVASSGSSSSLATAAAAATPPPPSTSRESVFSLSSILSPRKHASMSAQAPISASSGGGSTSPRAPSSSAVLVFPHSPASKDKAQANKEKENPNVGDRRAQLHHQSSPVTYSDPGNGSDSSTSPSIRSNGVSSTSSLTTPAVGTGSSGSSSSSSSVSSSSSTSSFFSFMGASNKRLPLPRPSGNTMNHASKLHEASELGETDMAKKFLANLLSSSATISAISSTVNAKDVDGWTPLMHACYHGNFEVAQLLLNCPHTNVNCVNSNGHSAIHYLIRQFIAPFSGLWRSGIATPGSPAVSETHSPLDALSILDMLVQKGASLKLQDGKGQSLLHLAVSTGGLPNIELLRWLLAHKLDVNAQNCSGLTPIHLAATKQHKDTIALLVQAGANVDLLSACNTTAWSPLDTSFEISNFISSFSKTRLLIDREVPGLRESMQQVFDQVAEIGTTDLMRTFGTQVAKDKFFIHMKMNLMPSSTNELFRMFDRSNDRRVDYFEFISSLRLMMMGTPEERLKLAFRMYALDGEESISPEHIQTPVDTVRHSMTQYNITLDEELEAWLSEFRELFPQQSTPVEATPPSALRPKFAATKSTEISVSQLLLQSSNEPIFLTFEEWQDRVLQERNHPILQKIGFPFHGVIDNRAQFKLYPGHPSFFFMERMMLGIWRVTKRSDEFVLPDELKKSDYSQEVEVLIGHGKEKFIDAAPSVFNAIRSICGVSLRDYTLSLGPERMYMNFLLGSLATYRTLASTAKSGSSFYESIDGRYLIKTLSQAEYVLLKKLLPSYYEYIRSNPSTLLTRFYGLHSFTFDGSIYYITIMENVFVPRIQIHEQYDLKGSTVDRIVISGESAGALKDLNFIINQRKLHVDFSTKAAFLEQLESDSKWLEAHNIVDYSLLVGVHKVGETTKACHKLYQEATSPSAFKQNLGGMASVCETEIYYLSIIDILIQYSVSKRAEKALKSFVHNQKEISVNPPADYRLRFQNFIASIFA